MSAPRVILASVSPRRRELLALLGISFEVLPSAYQEVLPHTHPDPAALAMHLAREKAVGAAERHPGAVVIGADTVVVLADRVYGKPADPEEAVRMLEELSGRTHRVITGVALIGPRGCPEQGFAVSTEVRFRALHPAEIQAYAATGEPQDKAGAYAIQGRGAALIAGISGDYPNVVGLPLCPLALALRERGVPVLGVGRAESPASQADGS